MPDGSVAQSTKESTVASQSGSGLSWTDPRTPFSWRGWTFGRDTLRFGGNESPYPPPKEVLDAIVTGADRLNRYPFGMDGDLTEGLSEQLGCSPEQVIIAPGTTGLLEGVIRALGGPEREVVYPDPSFPVYGSASAAVRAEARPVPLTPDGTCDIEATARACGDRTTLAIVCNPNNPTGGMAPTKTLEALIDGVPARTLLMVDEAYWEFTDEYAGGGRGAIGYLDCGRPLLVTRTFSKFQGLAGLRVGYAVASSDILAHELRARLRLGGTSAAGLVAAEAALGLVEVFNERAERIKAERERLCQAFGDLGLDPAPTQTNFVFCRKVDDDLPAKLLAADCWVRDGQSVLIPGGMRVTVGSPEENDKLLGAVRAIMEG